MRIVKVGNLSLISTILAVLITSQAFAQADLFIRDTELDNGIEPYTGPGPVYLSPDIWVRHDPDSGFSPYPYPTASPTWTPAPHQNPEYRDTKTSRPNYVYVRIHNRGASATSGTERLKIYQAKASTGLDWPNAWVDNMDTACGMDLLHGIEITKPRRNAQSSLVTSTDLEDYRDAVIAIQSDPNFQYNDGVPYFEKQNTIHRIGGAEHGNPAFLPWHRELVNRFENLLRESNPLLTMLYWDFTQDPAPLFIDEFMGPSNAAGTVTGPLASALPTSLLRTPGVQTCVADSDATLLGASAYGAFSFDVERSPNHNCAHGDTGGTIAGLSTAVRDPFFFQLHGNVDRQWATWQRTGASPDKLDPVAVYGPTGASASLNSTMGPWDGGPVIPPWTGFSTTLKTSKDRSVVYPPIYDTAPLTIPVLQPDESVVLEIPWYPPNVNNYNCAGQAGHFCLLARIETQNTAPFGMNVSEGNAVGANTRNNNNIAWKNLTIVDDINDPAFLMLTGTTIHNFLGQEAEYAIRLVDRTAKRRFLLHEFADLALAVPDHIMERIDFRQMRGLKVNEMQGLQRKVLRITGKEPLFRVRLKPGERFTTEFAVQLREKKLYDELMAEPFLFDIEQVLGLPVGVFEARDETKMNVGGVRFELDLAQALDGDANELADLAMNSIRKIRFEVSRLRDFKFDETLAEKAKLLSPGEPIDLIIEDNFSEEQITGLMLFVDGKEVANVEEAKQLSRQLRFEKPGVHNILVRGRNANGDRVELHERVLVSEGIPPTVAAFAPNLGAMVKLGDTVTVLAETIPGFKRDIKDVTMHVKDDDQILSGLDLIAGDYPIVDRSQGTGPHELTFTPAKPGMYMLQVGARDDEGNLGVSSHIMFMVSEK